MKTIAWDVDDVLNDCMRTWFERTWLPAHPGCAVGLRATRGEPAEQRPRLYEGGIPGVAR